MAHVFQWYGSVAQSRVGMQMLLVSGSWTGHFFGEGPRKIGISNCQLQESRSELFDGKVMSRCRERINCVPTGL
jgi:hypothetical protein